MGVTQNCATEGCVNHTAYMTKTRPAWCLECIDDMFRQGLVEPVDPFEHRTAWRLVRCLTCGHQTHVRFEYVLDKNRIGEPVCRVCYWTKWAEHSRQGEWNEFHRDMLTLLQTWTPQRVLDEFAGTAVEDLVREWLDTKWWSPRRIVAHLDANGFDLVDPIASVHDGSDPVVARCRRCGRLSAERMVDVGFGCTCARNTRSSNPAAPVIGKVLLADSDLPALQWWDHEANLESRFRTVTALSNKVAAWVCPRCGHTFAAPVSAMTANPTCPRCESQQRAEAKAESDRLAVTPVAQVAELAGVWDDETNPVTVMAHSSEWTKYRMRCEKGHRFAAAPQTFLARGCPSCQAISTREENKKDSTLAILLPEVATQWHPAKNGKLTPQDVPWDSKRKVWWLTECCGHEWQETVRSRDKYKRLRCPNCHTILGSLAYVHPGMAAEWHHDNPVTAWHVRPNTATLAFTPRWVCATDPTHVWEMAVSARVAGGGCPDCRQVGKSNVELAHHKAAVEVFGGARSGVAVKDSRFVAQKRWTVDILIEAAGHRVAVEYDGAYWHREPAKVLVDETKSRDLLAAGLTVVRLREDDLPTLPIADDRYHEVRVYSSAPRPEEVMRSVQTIVTPTP